MSSLRVRLALTAVLAALLSALPPAANAGAAAPVIHVVSNRADLISGGDASITIDVPDGVRAATSAWSSAPGT